MDASPDSPLFQNMTRIACYVHHKGCYIKLHSSIFLCGGLYCNGSRKHQKEVEKRDSNPRPACPRAKNWLPGASWSYVLRDVLRARKGEGVVCIPLDHSAHFSPPDDSRLQYNIYVGMPPGLAGGSASVWPSHHAAGVAIGSMLY